MNKYVVMTDSTSDLPAEYLKEHNIDYAYMLLNWEDQDGIHEIPASLAWDILSEQEFYDIMRKGIRFRTSQTTRENYETLFEKHLKQGEDVLYIACSSGLSASINLAYQIADEMKEKYPNNKVIVIDSLRASMDLGLMVMDAVKRKDEGVSIEENARITMENRLNYIQIGTPDSLEYLKRAGRVTGSKAFFGQLFQIKPVLMFDDEGHNIALEKAKGRKNSLKLIAEMAKDHVNDASKTTVYLLHAQCSDEDVSLLKKNLLEITGFKEAVVQPLGPIIGASSGPGTINIYYRK